MRRRLRRTWTVGGLTALGAILWAARPMPQRASAGDVSEAGPPDSPPVVLQPGQPPLDASAFKVRLWHVDEAPPAPPVTATPPPRPVQVNLRLVAIIDDETQRHAALYDPQSLQILVVDLGQVVSGGLEVAQIGEDFVELRGPGVTARLVLEEARP